ncbi:MAG: glyceraldehyde-3-phosphate dehydrogenase [Rhodobacteraceae bacterium]|nr:glyceraldehyde-3-phosphate dehydrogenase [Paracoccaceae bacterium]
MTNRIALGLAALIAAALIADFAANDGQATIFLAKKFMNLVNLVKFWR